MHHVVTGEDISMSSWTYGDPAPPILRAYAGDPAKIRLIHGGIKETHVFHLHNHQWRLDPAETDLLNSANTFAEDYSLLLNGCPDVRKKTMIADSLTETIKFREFNIQQLEITAAKIAIRSVIYCSPLILSEETIF